MRNDKRGIAALRSLTALTLALCLLLSAVPAWAGSDVASSPSGLTPSTTKVYVKLSKAVLFFTGDQYGEGTIVQPGQGTVCQLYTDDWYTSGDGLAYYSVYYLNKRYNVLRSDVVNDIMTSAELETYITGTVWKQSVYETLRKSMDLVGDVRVHAVQLALSRLGYYSGKLDGSYGDQTHEAVQKFQRANGLTADGSVGPLTLPILYALASGNSAPTISTSPSTSSSPSAGTLKTTASVNLRKRASTSSARQAVIPKGVNLAYSDISVQGGITWYKVKYNGLTGWLMGTYVSAQGSSASPAIGVVTITKAGTRVRKTANGTKTGYVLAKGTTVDLIAQPTTAGGYTWYNIRTGSGLVGFVRGDCAMLGTTSSGGSSSGGTSSGGSSSSGSTNGSSSTLVPSSDKTFVRLVGNTKLFTTETKPSSGGVTVSSGTVLQMVTTDTYTVDGVAYCSLYYNNKKYNAVYSEISGGIMSSSDLSAYVNALLQGSLGTSLKRNLNLVGDIRVYSLQVALYNLGYYTGKLDGTYGSGTQSAVRNFQRASKITVDGSCGTSTWRALQKALFGSGSSSGGSSSGSGSTGGGSTSTPSVTVTDFGTINKIVKADWNYGDNGGELIAKGTYATVMDIETGKVFRIYRWSGASHADCVPATLNDTKTMCEIVGYNFDGSHPSSSQLSLIKADDANGHANYTWPDFNGNLGGKNIGSNWDRRPALLNVNGTVYPVSLYGYPHGFNGTDSFAKSKFPGGGYFYSTNAYYGMMCVHFVGSKTHTGTSPDAKHQESITKAWQYAQSNWPSLCQ